METLTALGVTLGAAKALDLKAERIDEENMLMNMKVVVGLVG